MVSLNVTAPDLYDPEDDERHPLLRSPRQSAASAQCTPLIWLSAFGCILMAGMEAVVFVPTFTLHSTLFDDEHAPWSLLVLIHVVVWVLLGAIYYLGERYYKRIRLRGYLSFYRDTQLIRRVPVAVFAGMNAVLLCISAFWSTNGDTSFDRKRLLEIIISVETAIALPAYFVHLVKCLRFNRSRQPPDVLEEFQQTNANTTMSSDFDFDVGLDNETLLEKQSDMLTYMKQYTVHLQQQVFALQAQLQRARQRR